MFSAKGAPDLRLGDGAMRDLMIRDEQAGERLSRLNYILSRESCQTFLEAFVCSVADLFDADRVLVGRIDVQHKYVRTLKVATGNQLTQNFCYGLAGTPCREVMRVGPAIHEDHVAESFPQDFSLREMGVRGYIAMPLYQGAQSIGIVVAQFKRPLEDADELLAVLSHYKRRLTADILTVESGERAALAIKGTSDGIIDWCLETDQIYLSARCRELLGYQSRDFTAGSETFSTLIHREDRMRFNSAFSAHLETGRAFDMTARIKVVGGNYRWFRIRGEAVRTPDGEASRFVGAMTDIHDLVEARQQATEASRAKSKFLATMSHEIRTPMNGVLGMSSLLSASELESSQREMVEMIQSSGQALLDILNDILDLAHIESGRFEVEDAVYNPADLVRSLEMPYRLKAMEKGLNFHLDIDPIADREAAGDPSRVRQILSNVLSNAIKFTDRGEIRMRCLMSQKEDGRHVVCYEIGDTGIGMDSDLMSRIFMPFSQAESELARKNGGTGLGLAIAKKLAELMGGDIRVESAPGAGSVFWLDLPADTQPAMDTVENEAADNLGGTA